MVLRVDKEKGYIDLSKRRVSAEDVQKCDERFQRSKAVHSIVRHVAETQHVEMEELYSKTAWPLYRKHGHAYEAFRVAISDPESIFNEEIMPGLEPSLRQAMLADICKRLTPTALKVPGRALSLPMSAASRAHPAPTRACARPPPARTAIICTLRARRP